MKLYCVSVGLLLSIAFIMQLTYSKPTGIRMPRLVHTTLDSLNDANIQNIACSMENMEEVMASLQTDVPPCYGVSTTFHVQLFT